MIQILKIKLDGLDSSLQDVIMLLDQADHTTLGYKPEPGKWNAVQILNHLYLSEARSLAYMRKKLPEIEAQFNTGFKQRYRSFLLNFFLNTPLKFKAPRGFGEMPEDLEYEKVRDAYLETRKDIHEVMGELSEKNLNRAIMKHPRIGKINAVQTLSFFKSHFNHHRRQIESRISNSRR